MNPVAFLFAGQGVDILPSALGFYRHSVKIRALLEKAAATAGLTAEQLLARGGRQLSSTRIAQPVLVALCLGVCEELTRRGLRPHFTAGHSLGELSAWSALGAISTDQAIELAAERGRLMAREASRHPGGMLALVDEGESGVDAALELGRTCGSLSLAARNAPREWVLSGDESALSCVASRFRSARIKTEGAWHSPAMAGALEEFVSAARSARQGPVTARLVQGRDGAIIEQPGEIPDLFAQQLVQPIDWMAVLSTLRGQGVRRFVTVGPGSTLRGLLRKNFGAEACVMPTETQRELEQTMGALQA